MSTYPRIRLSAAACLLAGLVLISRSPADDNVGSSKNDGPKELRAGISRGLEFLDRDARKWRQDHDCATCHHGAMTLLAYAEARRAGFAVANEQLSELVSWNKAQFFRPFDAKRDLSPHWKTMPVALSTILLAADAATLPGLSAADFATAETHIVRRQEADGSWPPPPPAHGPQPVFESTEIMTLRATLALQHYVRESAPDSPTRQCIARAVDELSRTASTETTQAAVFRLWLAARSGESADEVKTATERLERLQNADGGWSQNRELKSDAYATGEALCAMGVAHAPLNSPAISRARQFLLSTQREDGSWLMVPRTSPERNASKNLAPITYFGSAWGTLGLIRSLPTRGE